MPMGEKIEQRIFKIAAQVGYRSDQSVIDAHDHCHRSAADTGDDVGNSDDQSFEYAGEKFHIT